MVLGIKYVIYTTEPFEKDTTSESMSSLRFWLITASNYGVLPEKIIKKVTNFATV